MIFEDEFQGVKKFFLGLPVYYLYGELQGTLEVFFEPVTVDH